MTMASAHRPVQLCADLTVRRTDIRFWNESPEVVAIEFTVRNLGSAASAPTEATIAAAPLGVFVPGRPLTSVAVPSIEPGQEITVGTKVFTSPPPLVVKPEKATTGSLLTALDLADDDATARGTGAAFLPGDLFRLLGNPSCHWAGNLNIFVGGKPVERHMAQALRIYPGKLNLAMFIVGSGPDAYRFSLSGEGAAWESTLFEGPWFGRSKPHDTIDPGTWLRVPNSTMLMLAIQPPEYCRNGSVSVEVEQQSTSDTAVVEFSLDANAAGPGCFVV